jgi:phage tail tape-measure protein
MPHPGPILAWPWHTNKMTSVVHLTERRSRETVAALQHALNRALKGEIQGLALAMKPVRGPAEIVFTDLFRRKPAEAAASALRMSIRLNELQEAIDEEDERSAL